MKHHYSKFKKSFHERQSKIKPKSRKQKYDEEIQNHLNLMKTLKKLDPESIKDFKDLHLSNKTQKGLLENGFTIPTKVQQLTLVHSLQELDVVAAAKTGSGKTLAFIIPLLEVLYYKKWNELDGIGALIITPTRELSYQIYDVLNKVGKYHSFSAGLIIGGKDLKFEWSRVSHCNIIICTPGRLLQHMTENPAFSCDNLQFFVLDEADQCLSMGFAETMNLILEELPCERQTLLFSATQTRNVKDLIRAGCKDPIFCSAHEHSKAVTPKTLVENYVVCEEEEKLTFLWSFMKYHKAVKTLVFVATCKQVKFLKDLFYHLNKQITVMGLSGEMHQLRRMAVYDQFCKTKRALLFATDVAARGLDIPAVDWVIQLDCPEDVTTYIHRAGRTARLTSAGNSVLLLTPFQEEAMVASLILNNVPIEETDVDQGEVKPFQVKIEEILSKHVDLKEAAERAFKAYLKNIIRMKNKKVFCVSVINMDALARSLGLTVTPRVRFVEKFLKNSSQKKKNSEEEKAPPLNPHKELKTFNLGVSQDDESDDEFLIKSQAPPVPVSGEAGDTFKDLSLAFASDQKVVSKYKLAMKLSKRNIQVNKKIVFEEEEKPPALQVKEGTITGLDISEMQEAMRERDSDDKKLDSLRIKEKRRKEKLKLKNKLKKEVNERREKEELEDEDGAESEEYVDDALTNEIISDLPDPDKVYGKQEESESDSSSEESESETKCTTSENDRSSKTKKSFKGKRKAKEAAREKKRAKISAENDLDAISFQEKEDLALFLLKGGR